jgi:hypothetical protein
MPVANASLRPETTRLPAFAKEERWYNEQAARDGEVNRGPQTKTRGQDGADACRGRGGPSRGPVARALFSAVHGIVTLGLEEKLGAVSSEELRNQTTLIVSAIVIGLLAPGKAV